MTNQDPIHWLERVTAVDPTRRWLTDELGTETYGELEQAVIKTAHLLIAHGVAPGDRVAAQIEKSRFGLHLYLACLWIGAVYLPLNTGYIPSELDYFMTNAEPALFITDEEAPYAPAGPKHLTLTVKGEGSFFAVDPAPKQQRTSFPPETLAAMLYTSGTTGKPKGAMLTRANLFSSAETLVAAWQFSAKDVLIHALPIFHVHGLFVATNTILAAGASMDLLAKFDPDAVIDRFATSTCLMGVPTFYTRLLSHERLTKDAAQPMRLFISGSAPLLAETHKAFEARTGQMILERYGMTETMMNTSNPYEGRRVAGTVGPALPGVSVRVADPETGRMLPTDEIGGIEVKGPNVFAGYWRMPEKTASEFRADGFFITGDLGKIDHEGYVHIIGRGKDLIISGGLNIYPKEVEEAIDALPGVEESAVVGVPHPDFGEAVVAIVVGTATPEAIKAGIAATLARFKQPRIVEIVDALPRNTMGKVQKSVLREARENLFNSE
jgi:malonyl-CoA/methylmalonyl-CoA synthetase